MSNGINNSLLANNSIQHNRYIKSKKNMKRAAGNQSILVGKQIPFSQQFNISNIVNSHQHYLNANTGIKDPNFEDRGLHKEGKNQRHANGRSVPPPKSKLSETLAAAQEFEMSRASNTLLSNLLQINQASSQQASLSGQKANSHLQNFTIQEGAAKINRNQQASNSQQQNKSYSNQPTQNQSKVGSRMNAQGKASLAQQSNSSSNLHSHTQTNFFSSTVKIQNSQLPQSQLGQNGTKINSHHTKHYSNGNVAALQQQKNGILSNNYPPQLYQTPYRDQQPSSQVTHTNSNFEDKLLIASFHQDDPFQAQSVFQTQSLLENDSQDQREQRNDLSQAKTQKIQHIGSGGRHQRTRDMSVGRGQNPQVESAYFPLINKGQHNSRGDERQAQGPYIRKGIYSHLEKSKSQESSSRRDQHNGSEIKKRKDSLSMYVGVDQDKIAVQGNRRHNCGEGESFQSQIEMDGIQLPITSIKIQGNHNTELPMATYLIQPVSFAHDNRGSALIQDQPLNVYSNPNYERRPFAASLMPKLSANQTQNPSPEKKSFRIKYNQSVKRTNSTIQSSHHNNNELEETALQTQLNQITLNLNHRHVNEKIPQNILSPANQDHMLKSTLGEVDQGSGIPKSLKRYSHQSSNAQSHVQSTKDFSQAQTSQINGPINVTAAQILNPQSHSVVNQFYVQSGLSQQEKLKLIDSLNIQPAQQNFRSGQAKGGRGAQGSQILQQNALNNLVGQGQVQGGGSVVGVGIQMGTGSLRETVQSYVNAKYANDGLPSEKVQVNGGKTQGKKAQSQKPTPTETLIQALKLQAMTQYQQQQQIQQQLMANKSQASSQHQSQANLHSKGLMKGSKNSENSVLRESVGLGNSKEKQGSALGFKGQTSGDQSGEIKKISQVRQSLSPGKLGMSIHQKNQYFKLGNGIYGEVQPLGSLHQHQIDHSNSFQVAPHISYESVPPQKQEPPQLNMKAQSSGAQSAQAQNSLYHLIQRYNTNQNQQQQYSSPITLTSQASMSQLTQGNQSSTQPSSLSGAKNSLLSGMIASKKEQHDLKQELEAMIQNKRLAEEFFMKDSFLRGKGANFVGMCNDRLSFEALSQINQLLSSQRALKDRIKVAGSSLGIIEGTTGSNKQTLNQSNGFQSNQSKDNGINSVNIVGQQIQPSVFNSSGYGTISGGGSFEQASGMHSLLINQANMVQIKGMDSPFQLIKSLLEARAQREQTLSELDGSISSRTQATDKMSDVGLSKLLSRTLEIYKQGLSSSKKSSTQTPRAGISNLHMAHPKNSGVTSSPTKPKYQGLAISPRNLQISLTPETKIQIFHQPSQHLIDHPINKAITKINYIIKLIFKAHKELQLQLLLPTSQLPSAKDQNGVSNGGSLSIQPSVQSNAQNQPSHLIEEARLNEIKRMSRHFGLQLPKRLSAAAVSANRTELREYFQSREFITNLKFKMNQMLYTAINDSNGMSQLLPLATQQAINSSAMINVNPGNIGNGFALSLNKEASNPSKENSSSVSTQQKFYVGRGNNDAAVKSVLKQRSWWIQHTEEDFSEVNLIWTQWKKQKHLDYLVQNGSNQVNRPFRLYGKMEQNKQLTNKKGVFVNMRDYYRQMEKDPFEVLPLTFLVKHGLNDPEFKRFTEYFNSFTQKAKVVEQQRQEALNTRQRQLQELKDQKVQERKEKLNGLGISGSKKKKKRKGYESEEDEEDEEVEQSDEEENSFEAGADQDEEIKEIKRKYRVPKNVWIIKPGENTNRGNGINVSSNFNEIKNLVQSSKGSQSDPNKEKTYIIQKYIDYPLLIHSRKFDFRCYGLLTSLNGQLKGYFYEDAYIRTSCKEFDIDNLNNKYIHLTNDAVQKHSQDYGKYENGNKMSLSDFQKYLRTQMPNLHIDIKRDLMPQIRALVTDSYRAAYGKIDPGRLHNTFELFGYDFMLDEDFRLYLIEVNTNPCLEMSCPLLCRIIPEVLDNAFKIVLDPIFPSPDLSSNKKYSINEIPQEIKFTLVFDEGIDGPELKKLQTKFHGIKEEIESDEESELAQDEANEIAESSKNQPENEM